MRLRILTALAAGIAIAFTIAAPSQAQEGTSTGSVNLLWDDTDNLDSAAQAGIGTDTMDAQAGDALSLGVYLDLDSGASAAILGISLEFDNDGGNELDLTGANELKFAPTYGCTPFPTCYVNFGPALSNTDAGVSSTLDSTGGPGGAGGLVYTFEQGTLGTGPSGPVSIKMGEVFFTVTSNVTSDGVDIVSGDFNTGVDGNFDNDGFAIALTFNDATVNELPEPSAAIAGLAALGALATLVRRKR